MNQLPKNVWILTLALALMMSASSLVVFVGSIVGTDLAPDSKMATLPVAAIIIGTALSIVPVTLLMKRFGRRAVFITITLVSVFVSLLAAYSIHNQSFYLFCGSMALLGISVANLNQFRFAAMESVPTHLISKAASTVLVGGIAAAFVGPEIALQGKNLFSTSFCGSFILLALIFVLGSLILLLFQNAEIKKDEQSQSGRPISEIIKQPIFWVAVLCGMIGYAVMSFIMTATPVSMHVMDGHSLEDTKWVIQSHITAMFLPSLFTGWIISKIGNIKMILVGILAFTICIVIAYSGHQVGHYWWSLLLLGLGWNFLFIGGTTLLPSSYRESERFKVQALNEFLVFGVQAIAALSAGIVVFAMGWEAMLLITVPLLFIPLIAIYINHRGKV